MPGALPSGPPGLYIQARDYRWLQVNLISSSGKLQCEGETISHFLYLRRGKWKAVPSRRALPYLASGLSLSTQQPRIQPQKTRRASPKPSINNSSADDSSSAEDCSSNGTSASSERSSRKSPIVSKPRAKVHRKSSSGHDENDASSSSFDSLIAANTAIKTRLRNGLKRSSENRQIDENDASSSDDDITLALKPVPKAQAKVSPLKRQLKLTLSKKGLKKSRPAPEPEKSSGKITKEKDNRQAKTDDESEFSSSSDRNAKAKPQTRSQNVLKKTRAVTSRNITKETTPPLVNDKNYASTASSDAARKQKSPLKPSPKLTILLRRTQTKKGSEISAPKSESEKSSGDEFDALNLKLSEATRRLTRTQLRESPREKLDLLNSLKLMSKTDSRAGDNTKKPSALSNLARTLRRRPDVASMVLETSSDEESQTSGSAKKSPRKAQNDATDSNATRTLRPRVSNQLDKSGNTAAGNVASSPSKQKRNLTSSPSKEKRNLAPPPSKKKMDISSTDEFSLIGKPTFTSSPRVAKRPSVPVQRLHIVRNDSTTRSASGNDSSLKKSRETMGRSGNSILHRNGYSPHEDKAIVDYILKHRAERLVNGNEIWRKMSYAWPDICPSEPKRSFHSLRNRYLRYLLPTAHLLPLPTDTIKSLRIGAHTGTMKKSRENSLLVDKRGPRSAWSKRPRRQAENNRSDVAD